MDEIETINTITIEGKEFKIEKSSGGDLKWLAHVYGINSANSCYPCIWCTWNCKEKLDLSIDWSISGRSHATAEEKLCNKDERCGYKNEAIFKCIPFNKAVVDPLHMNLRITENLINKLIAHLEQLDGNKSIDISKRPMFKLLWDFFEKTCNITKPFYNKIKENKQSTIKMRTLNSNERLRILDRMFKTQAFLEILPEKHRTDETILTLNEILREFYDIFVFIKKDHTLNFDETSLRKRLKDWLKLYMKIESKITPYIHIFVFHVPEFISIYKNLNLHTMQGLEKLNDVTKNNFFRQTNRKKNQYTTILLEKANRSEFINLKGEVSEIYNKIKEIEKANQSIQSEKTE